MRQLSHLKVKAAVVEGKVGDVAHAVCLQVAAVAAVCLQVAAVVQVAAVARCLGHPRMQAAGEVSSSMQWQLWAFCQPVKSLSDQDCP